MQQGGEAVPARHVGVDGGDDRSPARVFGDVPGEGERACGAYQMIRTDRADLASRNRRSKRRRRALMPMSGEYAIRPNRRESADLNSGSEIFSAMSRKRNAVLLQMPCGTPTGTRGGSARREIHCRA